MILSHFEARPNYTFVEFDYKQLEIRVLALASGDKQLIDDINRGVDMHTYFAAQIFNKAEEEISPGERKMAKGFSFQLQYGSSANGIARFWDVSKLLAEAFIDKYYQRYPQVRSWQQGVLSEASDTIQYAGDRREGLSVQRAYIPTTWRSEFDVPLARFKVLSEPTMHSRKPYVSTTKCKNYPIQGAAADIMILMLNRLSKAIWGTNSHILNTVHDSVLLEHPDYALDKRTAEGKRILEDVPSVLREVLGVEAPVEFPVDFSCGKTLSEVKGVV